MSDLRSIDYRIIAEMVECLRGPGYVLDFSDTTFAEFFADEFNVDIDANAFREDGDSKGKRLRCFLRKADNATALKVLDSLWTHRQYELERLGQADQSTGLAMKIEQIKDRLRSGEQGSSADVVLPPAYDTRKYAQLRAQLYDVRNLSPQKRGYEFESFLKSAFNQFGLQAEKPFRNTGEQIDGSFVLDHEVYLLEAKWVENLVGVAELRAFHGKLEKATWTRGLFVSYSGFTDVGLAAFGNAKSLVCVDGQDIYEAFGANVPLDILLRRKVRKAAESGKPFVPFRELDIS